MPQDRRSFLKTFAGASAFAAFYDARARALGDRVAADTAAILTGATEAAQRGGAFMLPPGVTAVHPLGLPEGAHLVGHPRGSTLRLAGTGPLVTNLGPCDRLTFEGVGFDGAGRPINGYNGLLSFEDVAHVAIDACTFRNSTIALLQRRCGGRIRLSAFLDLTDTAIYDERCAGVVIEANTIRRCGENGIHHWGASQHDGSRIADNVITDIHNRPGADGMYGNGVRVAQCGPVTIENNVVERCAYSAIRNCGGRSVLVAGNRCKSFLEKAMYAEFGFRDATFRNNVIEDCTSGIAATNYLGPGDGDRALIEGNVISLLHAPRPREPFGPRVGWPSGIEGEGDAVIVGNTVVGSPWLGLQIGNYAARHNVTAQANRLIDNQYAIGVATQDGVGPCAIIGNDMRGSKKANIVAMYQERILDGDLSISGAGAYRDIVLRDNRVS